MNNEMDRDIILMDGLEAVSLGTNSLQYHGRMSLNSSANQTLIKMDSTLV